MSPDTHADDYEREAYRVPNVADRMTRRVHDEHGANQVLHDTLKAAFDTAAERHQVTINLMASHGPGEKDHRPRHYVRVESTNEGMGHPILPKPVRRLVERNDAKLVDVIECSDDHLVVSVRPVTTRVEPITVDKQAVKRLAERAGVLDE